MLLCSNRAHRVPLLRDLHAQERRSARERSAVHAMRFRKVEDRHQELQLAPDRPVADPRPSPALARRLDRARPAGGHVGVNVMLREVLDREVAADVPLEESVIPADRAVAYRADEWDAMLLVQCDDPHVHRAERHRVSPYSGILRRRAHCARGRRALGGSADRRSPRVRRARRHGTSSPGSPRSGRRRRAPRARLDAGLGVIAAQAVISRAAEAR
jgi:hypothetical protein